MAAGTATPTISLYCILLQSWGQWIALVAPPGAIALAAAMAAVDALAALLMLILRTRKDALVTPLVGRQGAF